jgi:hypothetical protein
MVLLSTSVVMVATFTVMVANFDVNGWPTFAVVVTNFDVNGRQLWLMIWGLYNYVANLVYGAMEVLF